jgi:hypothetical protein
MRLLLRFIQLTLITIGVGCTDASINIPPPTLVDVFPLSVGASFWYDYQYTNTDRDMSPGTGSRDSGTVVYQIGGLVQSSDAIRVWNVLETVHLQHTRYWLWDFNRGAFDSSSVQWLDTTISRTLFESGMRSPIERIWCIISTTGGPGISSRMTPSVLNRYAG